MVDAGTRRRRGASRARSLGAAVSLLAHLAFLALTIVGLQGAPGALPPGPAVDVELITASPATPSARTRSGTSSTVQATATERQPITPPPIAERSSGAAALPAPAPLSEAAPIADAPPVPAPPAPPSALASALRGSIGCDHSGLLGLSPAERERCRDRFAKTGKVPADLTALEGLAWVALSRDGAAGLDPEKRAAFDAAWKADHSPQHMAALGCFMRFGGGKVEWLRPSEGFRLGRLPCYFVAPKATLSADPPAAQK
jgi:hypothetical protein